MPHLTLEYSPNVLPNPDLSGLFQALHEVMATTGGVKIENCKSRAYVARGFFVGSGSANGAFVHLEIRLMEGRSPDTRRAIGREAGRVLLQWCKDVVDTLDLQVTVEVRDIERHAYFKFPEGTLTPL